MSESIGCWTASIDEVRAPDLVVRPAEADTPPGVMPPYLVQSADGILALTVDGLPPADDPEEAFAWGRSTGRQLDAIRSRPSGGRSVLDLRTALWSLEDLGLAIAGLFDGAGGADAVRELGIVLASDFTESDVSAVVRGESSRRRGVELARRLTDARANQLSPADFAMEAATAASETGLGCRIHSSEDLGRLGMGGILAIGSGSPHPPFLVELWYNGSPDGPPSNSPPRGAVALVGKGITFDSGGLSLKPPAGLPGMHVDCAGAATVLGAMATLPALGCRTPAHAVLPIAENMPGPGCVRPGDVVRSYAGIGVEIVDTDFEGRVIMADALAWAAENDPRAIVDVATLTYQAVTALGPEIGALIARDPDLGRRVRSAARSAAEPLWELPWAPRYRRQLDSSAPGAVLRNHPGTDSGRALTAALFLGEFVPRGIPWGHLDIAGPAVLGGFADMRATGYGTRMLVNLLAGWHNAPSAGDQGRDGLDERTGSSTTGH